MNNILSKNLKRLRKEKNYTQEQAAERLKVSTQTISRWECGNTLPDVLMLPEIARLYCVTVDELYKETSLAYESYAQRLASVYEQTKNPNDFIAADTEFKKLLENADCTVEDMRMYGILNHFMMQYCMDKALALFDEVISSTERDEDIYLKTKLQKILLLSQTGRNSESIESQLKLVEKEENHAAEWVCLIAAYRHSGQEEKAYKCFKKAAALFPDSAVLYLYGGDICKALGDYEKAFSCWDRALELDDSLYDAKYAKGFCFEELCEYKKAYEIWCELADELKEKGYEHEFRLPQKYAKACKRKMVANGILQ